MKLTFNLKLFTSRMINTTCLCCENLFPFRKGLLHSRLYCKPVAFFDINKPAILSSFICEILCSWLCLIQKYYKSSPRRWYIMTAPTHQRVTIKIHMVEIFDKVLIQSFRKTGRKWDREKETRRNGNRSNQLNSLIKQQLHMVGEYRAIARYKTILNSCLLYWFPSLKLNE